MKPDLVRVDDPQQCVSSAWELAYERFETPEEEIAKFTSRLLKTGAASWPREAQIVEIFCGRGGGLHALSRLGFTAIEGADLSERLLAKYDGSAKCYVCDCRQLPFETASRDIVIVQGGLHHLPEFPGDVEAALKEMRRVLRPGGFAVIVEPWRTPFLRLVHAITSVPLLRKIFPKFDSFAIMYENECETYDRWLGAPKVILGMLGKVFDCAEIRTRWGKIVCVARVGG